MKGGRESARHRRTWLKDSNSSTCVARHDIRAMPSICAANPGVNRAVKCAWAATPRMAASRREMSAGTARCMML